MIHRIVPVVAAGLLLSAASATVGPFDPPPERIVAFLATETPPGSGILDVSWTAPVDEDLKAGAVILNDAMKYDFRVSLEGIVTLDDFLTATIIHLGVPGPGPHGTTDHVQIAGLDTTLTWHFAVRALGTTDTGLGWSGLSVPASFRFDRSPPPPVTGLKPRADLAESTAMPVEWVAASADTAEVRIHFADRTPVTDWLPAGDSGAVIDGLSPETTYQFIAKARDINLNESGFSAPSAPARTLPAPIDLPGPSDPAGCGGSGAGSTGRGVVLISLGMLFAKRFSGRTQ